MNLVHAFIYLFLGLICFGCSSSQKEQPTVDQSQVEKPDDSESQEEQVKMRRIMRMIDANRGGR